MKYLKRLYICRYFSHGLYFHLPSSIFWRAEVLDFEVQFIIFFPIVCAFCGLRDLPQQRFPSRSFTVLVFALRTIIHLKLIFTYYSRYGTTLLLFCIYVYSVLTSFVENHLKMNIDRYLSFWWYHTVLIDYSIGSLKIGHCGFSRFFL